VCDQCGCINAQTTLSGSLNTLERASWARPCFPQSIDYYVPEILMKPYGVLLRVWDDRSLLLCIRAGRRRTKSHPLRQKQMTPHQSVNDTRAETRHEARSLFQLLSSPTVRQDKARAVDIRCGKRRGSMRSDQASASLYRPPDWPCARLPGRLGRVSARP
jgi:hypothetical protein